MSYQGDIRVGQVLYFHFTTRQFSTGAPITSASLAISVYKDDSTTQSTSGVTTTFTTGFDGVVGLVSVKIDTSADGTFYAAAHDFSVVVTTGTADSVSIVGEVIGGFSIENRSALMPTTAARKLDVSAGGEAGVDWANVGSPTTSLALTGTTIAVTQKVDVDTIKTNPVVNGGTITFPTTATLASTTNITAGTVTTATNVTTVNGLAANVITAAATAADFSTEVNAAPLAILGTPAGASMSADIAAAKVDTAAIKVVTDKFVFTVANQVDSNVITKTGFSLAAAYDFAKGTTAVAESYRANGAAPTPAQALCEILAHLGEVVIASTTKTINKLDHSTPAATFTLDSATTPAAITRAT